MLLSADNAIESDDKALPDPPLKDLFRDMQEAAEDLHSRDPDETLLFPDECEQCGSKLVLPADKSSAV